MMDIMRSGISPDTYLAFMEYSENLAILRKQFKFTDQDLLGAVTYYELQQAKAK